MREELLKEQDKAIAALRKEADVTEARRKLVHEIHKEMQFDRVLRHAVKHDATRWEDLPWSGVMRRIEKMQNLIRRLYACPKI